MYQVHTGLIRIQKARRDGDIGLTGLLHVSAENPTSVAEDEPRLTIDHGRPELVAVEVEQRGYVCHFRGYSRLARMEEKLDGFLHRTTTIETRTEAHDARLRVLEQGQAKIYVIAGAVALAISTFGSSVFEKLAH